MCKLQELENFLRKITNIPDAESSLTIDSARQIIKEINEFLYTNYPNIGYTYALDKEYEYLSDFHKFWERNYKDILNVKIDEEQCFKVADVLHEVYERTTGAVFKQVYDTCGLSKEDVCRIRFLSANQDFNGALDFAKLAGIFNDDKSIFDEHCIINEPTAFINAIKVTNLSQSDKREKYAKNIAEFIIEHNCEPYEILNKYDKDVKRLRSAMINCTGAGYGNKKTDMFIRDMIVLGIWTNVKNFDSIDVASDVNTIKVALRTGIIKSEIPLVSSFLDIFCHQYTFVDETAAKAWRKVWEIWKTNYPDDEVYSPCLIDYFIYNVIGKQFCKENLFIFKCNDKEHIFKWHSGRNKTCQVCYNNGITNAKAQVIAKIKSCEDPEGFIAIKNSNFYKSNICSPNYTECPFKIICTQNSTNLLQPPKSISIKGQTGWERAYTRCNIGGGGLMA